MAGCGSGGRLEVRAAGYLRVEVGPIGGLDGAVDGQTRRPRSVRGVQSTELSGAHAVFTVPSLFALTQSAPPPDILRFSQDSTAGGYARQESRYEMLLRTGFGIQSTSEVFEGFRRMSFL